MENYKFFNHKDCEYFPCHDTKKPEEFNCLFCYCPLYTLGDRCGGNFRYTENDVKDCSSCMVPHSKGAYDYIRSRFSDLMDLAAENRSSGNRNE